MANWKRLSSPNESIQCKLILYLIIAFAELHSIKGHIFFISSRYTYRCARKSEWGDRYPIEFDETVGSDVESDWSDDEDNNDTTIIEK